MDRASGIVETKRLAQLAVQLGREDALSLAHSGYGLAYVVEDLDRGAALIDRALNLNSNLAEAWRYSGWVRVWLGDPEAAVKHFARAMRLNPVGPLFYAMESGTAFAYFFAGRYDEASAWADRSLQDQPGGPPHHQALRMAAAGHALAGRPEEAQRAMSRLRSIDPELCVSKLKELTPLRRPADIALYEDGLRMAGLPE
jgi:adenylate cyclase